MEIDKKGILLNLEEVSELHPLLRELFNKLPNIEKVEYSHGVDEFGADFILTNRNEILGDAEYIGIIAKTGKISQNIQDIKRQIEECDEERFIQNGGKKILLDEIWVVVTGHITTGAQTNIHREYKSRKIKFLSGENLIDLIDTYLPSYWKGITPSLGYYLDELRIQTEELDKAVSLFTIKDKSISVNHRLR